MNLHEYLEVEGGRKATVAIPFPEDDAVLETVKSASDNGWARFLFIETRRRSKRPRMHGV